MWGSIGVGETITDKFRATKSAGFDGVEVYSHLSREEVLKAAMAAEKDSIAFYAGMCEMVRGDLGKGKVRTIIKEEMSHMVILAGKLKQLG